MNECTISSKNFFVAQFEDITRKDSNSYEKELVRMSIQVKRKQRPEIENIKQILSEEKYFHSQV